MFMNKKGGLCKIITDKENREILARNAYLEPRQ